MQEPLFSLRDVIYLVVFVAGIISTYWRVRIKLDKKLDAEAYRTSVNAQANSLLEIKTEQLGLRGDMNLLKNDKIGRQELQTIVNGVRLTIGEGMRDMAESYHEVDKKSTEFEFRLKRLESERLRS